MHRYFPDLVPFDEARMRQIFQDGFIALDTNVLLAPYRMGEAQQEAWFIWLEQTELNSRLFLPFQVQREVLTNRRALLNEWQQAYDSMITKVEVEVRKAKENLRQQFPPSRYPHIQYGDIDAAFSQATAEIKRQVEAERDRIPQQQIGDPDPIYNRLQSITGPHTGQPFNENERQAIYESGRTRYTRKIPPGYADATKPDPQRYGDLLLWEELIREAEKTQKPAIFVTNDQKADWFDQQQPKSARWELNAEFLQRTQQIVLIWSLERFQMEAHRYLSITEYTPPTTTPEVAPHAPAVSAGGGQSAPTVQNAPSDAPAGQRDVNGVLLTEVLPSEPVQLSCFDFRVSETGRLRLDPIGREITFDPETLSDAEREAFAQWGTSALGLIATSGLDQYTLINTQGAAFGDYDGEIYRAWLIPDNYSNSPTEYFPTVLIKR